MKKINHPCRSWHNLKALWRQRAPQGTGRLLLGKSAEHTFQAQVHGSLHQDADCKSPLQLGRALLGRAHLSCSAVAADLGGGRSLLEDTGWRQLELIALSGELLRLTVAAAVHGVQITSGLSERGKRGKNHVNSQGSSWEVGSISSKQRIHTCKRMEANKPGWQKTSLEGCLWDHRS